MEIVYVRRNEVKNDVWMGGDTFEYYIYPTNKSYKELNFIFRVSCATITIQPSVFTKFKGYTRYLTMLDQPLTIDINEKRSIMSTHQIIKFESNDNTVSYSKGQDFNLMVNRLVSEHSLLATDRYESVTAKHLIIFALYESTITINGDSYQLSINDCIVINNTEVQEINLTMDEVTLIGLINY